MASRDFNLAKFEFKRLDGSGKVFSCSETPAALVRSNRAKAKDAALEEVAMMVAFYSAQAAGLLKEMGVDLSDCKTDDDKGLRLFDLYSAREILCDDNGNPIKPEESEESDPTSAKSRASRS